MCSIVVGPAGGNTLSFPAPTTRWRGHSLRGRRVRHLQRRSPGLLRGGAGAAGGGWRQADGGDGEEAGEGRVHRRHDPRPEVKRNNNLDLSTPE